MSMSNETWFKRFDPMAVPCPKCGGKVWFGIDFDWPPELGGNYIGDRCVCEGCKAEWTTDDAPKEFTTPDGEYWNVVLQDES